MTKRITKPIDTLLEWDEICREFGCSDSQLRELYSAPCPDSAPATESYDEVMDALRKEAEQQQPAYGDRSIEKQN
jgi:hypothetical protein